MTKNNSGNIIMHDGKAVKTLLIKYGYTQVHLSEKLKMSRQNLGKMLGRKNLNTKVLSDIARVFGLDLVEIIRISDTFGDSELKSHNRKSYQSLKSDD